MVISNQGNLVTTSDYNYKAEGKGKFVETRYADYESNIALWDTLRKAYKGGKKYIDKKVIPQYYSEAKRAYDLRLLRAININFPETILGIRASYLEQGKIEVKSNNNNDLSKRMNEILNNIDGKKHDKAFLVGRISKINGIYGCCLLMPDFPPNDDVTILSKYDEMVKGKNPYIYAFDPRCLMNYEQDYDNNFEWILLKNSEVYISFDVNSVKPKLIETRKPPYILFTKSSIKYLDKDDSVISEVENKLGYVPIFVVSMTDIDDDIFGTILLDKIESLNRALLRTLSQLEDSNAKQAFSQLVTKGLEKKRKMVDGELKNQDIEISMESTIDLPDTGDAKYIYPDSSQGRLLIDTANQFVDMILYMSQLRKGDIKKGSEVPSGIAYAYEFINTDKSLLKEFKTIARGLTNCLNTISEMINENDTFTISGPNDYGMQTPDDYLNAYKAFYPGGYIPLSAQKELVKSVFALLYKDNDTIVQEVSALLDERMV